MRLYSYDILPDLKLHEFQITETDLDCFGNLLVRNGIPTKIRIGCIKNKRADLNEYLIDRLNKEYKTTIKQFNIVKHEPDGYMGSPGLGEIFYNIETFYADIIC